MASFNTTVRQMTEMFQRKKADYETKAADVLNMPAGRTSVTTG